VGSGYYTDANYRVRTLIEHFDGKAWTIVPTANPGAERNMFFSVNAINPNDVWAAGGSQDSSDGNLHTLIEHWDGHTWSVSASPNPGPNGNELFGITAAGPNNVWAVGQQQGTAFPGKALVEHWDGHSWQAVAGPGQGGYTYNAVAATISGSWLVAVGALENDKRPQSSMAFTVAGSHAATTTPVQVGSFENDFYGVTSDGKVTYAAGRSTESDPNAQKHATLVEQYVDGRWSVTCRDGSTSLQRGACALPRCCGLLRSA
jgi:hypothetical protein